MDKNTQAVSDDLHALAEDARALMTATADVAGDKVEKARKRLAEALENSKVLYGRMKDKAVEGAKATDQAVRTHPYESIGIAVGVGVLVGFLIGRSCSHKD